MSMRRKIADLYTEFRVQGLNTVQAALSTFTTTANRALRTVGIPQFLGAVTRGTLLASRGLIEVGRRLGVVTMAAGRYAKTMATVATAAGVGAFTAIGKSIKYTSEDILEINRLALALGVSFRRVAALAQIGKGYGVDFGDLRGSLIQFSGQVSAALQGSDAQAQYFKMLGVELKGANGQARDFLSILYDVARAQKKLAAPDRAMVLSQLFGEDDASNVSEFLGALGANPKPLSQQLDTVADSGASYDERSLAAAKKFRAATNDLKDAWSSFTKEIFRTFGGPFSEVVWSAAQVLRNNYKPIVEGLAKAWNAVVGPAFDALTILGVNHGAQWNNTWVAKLEPELLEIKRRFFQVIDLMKRFWGAATDESRLSKLQKGVRVVYDFFQVLIGGNRNGSYIRTSFIDRYFEKIFDLHHFLKGLPRLVADVYRTLTGDWNNIAPDNKWVLYLYNDLVDAVERIKLKIVNAGVAATVALLGFVQKAIDVVQNDLELIAPFVDLVRNIIRDVQQQWAKGMVDGATTPFGAIAGGIKQAAMWTAELVRQIDAVFMKGQEASSSFAWLNDVKAIIDQWGPSLVQGLSWFRAFMRELFGGLFEINEWFKKTFGFDLAATLVFIGLLRFSRILGLVWKGLGLIGTAIRALFGAQALASFASAGTALGGFMGALTGLIAKLGSAIVGLIATASTGIASILSGLAARAGLAGVASSIAGLASGLAGAVATGIGAIASLPVLLGAAAVGTAGFAAYAGYKYLTSPDADDTAANFRLQNDQDAAMHAQYSPKRAWQPGDGAMQPTAGASAPRDIFTSNDQGWMSQAVSTGVKDALLDLPAGSSMPSLNVPSNANGVFGQEPIARFDLATPEGKTVRVAAPKSDFQILSDSAAFATR
jgi:hypothetical protein